MLPYVVARASTFPLEGDGFSYEQNKEYIDKRFKELCQTRFYGEFAGVISKEHLKLLVELKNTKIVEKY